MCTSRPRIDRPFVRLAAFCGLTLALPAINHFSAIARADGPADNHPESVRRIPPLGIELAPEVRSELEQELGELDRLIEQLRLRRDALTPQRLPDVLIFSRAVHQALEHQEFFAERDVASARRLLQTGRERAEELLQGRAPWTTQTGLVVRGFVSRLDETVQPYGLVVPTSFRPRSPDRHRCDVWLHGRGETVGEVRFLDQRMRDAGRFAPADTFVLHPYGRYSNAFKFAGEVDVLEALEHVQANYPIDDDRIAIRGFSMGGAGCWQMAVHFPDRWFAANPGAGFSETPEFLRFFQKEELDPTWYERKLWRLYDCPGYAVNLFNCPTVAYSGELDLQKQAADVMQAALAQHGLRLVHLIGPDTKHSIHPQSAAEIAQRLEQLAREGRDRLPPVVRFSTYTLKYNRSHWVAIDALQEHWEQAVIAAAIEAGRIAVRTRNIDQFTLRMPPGTCPLDVSQPVGILVNGDAVEVPGPFTDRSFSATLHRDGDRWRAGPRPVDGLRKAHDLQGPVDDAFMDRFVFVRPSGQAAHPAVQKWVTDEREHARIHWRQQFRGKVLEKRDTEISEAEIAGANLILWGDPQSNAVLARIADQLPIRWEQDRIVVGDRSFDADGHAPILIYPNPLNPSRYVVLNSGFTYREYAYLNNARQVPMLPDWAIVDLSVPPNTQTPGRIAAAGFFDEAWQLQESPTE